MFFKGLTDSEAAALVDTAKAIKTEPQWLWDVVNFESGHNPQAANSKSSAKGLIQFTDATAKNLGYASSWDLIQKNPTYEKQMRGPVLKYFQGLGPPYTTRQALFMTVFFPVARAVAPDTTFSELYRVHGIKNFELFQKQNPGIVTVKDYETHVAKAAASRFPGRTLKTIEITSGGALLLLVSAFFFFKHRKARV